ncbi:hypothetical protein PIB30_117537 [Stylosanthes scabra]|uniref:Lethal giant larvae (Lgl)-like C-terminal domain-containing protein n=1 Tax=Stylosanthes scabra TaxID=79078 RepID=A0ABU6ZDX0_9FABA|nr:hypothetical protein [Stylosanthes scabra]
MQVLGSITKDGLDLREGNHVGESTTKQLYILLCSEKAAYVYSFVHAIQGIKRVLYKKKFHSSSCCWASTFYSSSNIGLVLLFTSGKVELRSLPELSLIEDTSIRGFTYSTPKLKSFSDSQICCSSSGDIVVVNSDQEIFVVSLLVNRNIFRLLESVTCIEMKERMPSQEELAPSPVFHKEKKKGIFSLVMKEFTGSKEKDVPFMEKEDPRESIRELSAIFSNANFPSDADNSDNRFMHEDEPELSLDDIVLDDPVEKRKEQSILGALNKKKLAGKLNAFKGRLKEKKDNYQKASDNNKEEPQDEKAGSVDQIKKKYGFSSSSSSSSSSHDIGTSVVSIAKSAQGRLQDNTRKLQGINLRATEMQDTAKSFSSLAKQMLRTAEQDRRNI